VNQVTDATTSAPTAATDFSDVTRAPVISQTPTQADYGSVSGTVTSPRSGAAGAACSRQTHHGAAARNPTRAALATSDDVDDDGPLDLTVTTATAPRDGDPAATDEAGGGRAAAVRPKSRRRKGVAHKLDATSFNEFPPGDVDNESFDVATVPSAMRPAAVGPSGRRSPSPRESSSEPLRWTDGADESSAQNGIGLLFRLPPSLY